ncbi:MAG: SMP-30/gluconolactonase/LRE family protein [Pseudomonadota bacterium]
MKITCVARTGSAVGEGAVWDDRAQCLWWVDIPAGFVYRFDPETGENRRHAIGEPVGCLAVRASGGLVLATRTGFWFFDPETGRRTPIADPEAHLPGNRFNDGATDAQGRFWAGTMATDRSAEPAGSLYRLDPDLTVTRWKGGFATPNGLAFSPDGTRMYFSDSAPERRTIWVSDYDGDAGLPGEPAVFLDMSGMPGRPDGGTTDADGCYWQAGIDGWRLYRISPGGEVLSILDMPVEKPTKPMFGGPSLDTLFVTSIGGGLTDPSAQPDAGGLFAITGLHVRGRAQTPFGG